MKPRLLLPLLLAAAAATAAWGTTEKFDRTSGRIADILARRLLQKPFPTQLPDPFLPPGAVPPSAPVAVANTADAPFSDIAALTRYAAELRVSGVLDIGGRPHLVINSSAYREGDLVKVRDTDPIDFIRVIRIAPRSMTLGYGEATLEVPLRLN